MAKTAADLVARAKARIDNLSVDQVAEEVAAGALVLDIREPEERQRTGTIPGAVSAPRGMLEFYADPSTPYHLEELQPGQRCILYCAAGGRSALGVRTLQEMGYRNVAHLDGGFRAWEEAGQKVARVPKPAATPASRSAPKSAARSAAKSSSATKPAAKAAGTTAAKSAAKPATKSATKPAATPSATKEATAKSAAAPASSRSRKPAGKSSRKP